jgi:hypothetical protein
VNDAAGGATATAAPAGAGVAEPIAPSRLEDDFSIAIGGPLYQLLRRARLTGDGLELVRRRMAAVIVLTWLPLAALATIDGKAWGDAATVPFLRDIDTHVRFLVALPLMILAELVVHRRMRGIVSQFVTLGLVQGAARARFDEAIERAMRLRNSIVAEVALIVLVYAAGRMLVWRQYVALDTPTWYATPDAGLLSPNPAGWWYFLVALPLFQFVLVRWYFRLFVWARFLWHVSRIDVRFAPMHPDRLGGIGFLTKIGYAFVPLLLAQGALLAGTLANRILLDGAELTAFKVDVFVVVLLSVAAVLGPLLVFVPRLAAAKRAGLKAYGHLGKRYIDEFEAKWLRGAPNEALVGSADVQSLADMAGSYDVVREMRTLPVTRDMLVQLAVMTLLPLAPLLLTLVSLEELLGRLAKILF